MTARYAVVGNPVAHSKSPYIHAAFAEQTGQKLTYEKIEAPLDGFEHTVTEFLVMGGAGCNVTVPFKEAAFNLANELSERAELAGAVNTLWLDDDGLMGDNTDGAGLVRDLLRHTALKGKRVLLLGAGGAARGVIAPLLDESIAGLTIANRRVDKAQALRRHFSDFGKVEAVGFADLAGEQFDMVVNATAASLAGERLPLPDTLWTADTLAYDMMYAKGGTPFMAQATEHGVRLALDGLGMLVEQAAEAFWLWRDIRPDTQPVLAALRAAL